MTAAYNPRSGETPEATAIAIDSGRATIATVSAANMSLRKQSRSYPYARTVAIFGRYISAVAEPSGMRVNRSGPEVGGGPKTGPRAENGLRASPSASPDRSPAAQGRAESKSILMDLRPAD